MPPQPANDVLDAKVRRLEARMAMVEDCLDIHGPPPKPVQLPKLSDEAKGLIFLAILIGAFVFAYTRPRTVNHEV